MATSTGTPTVPSSDLTSISFDDYLEKYSADYYEWVGGEIVKMSPIHIRHDELIQYFLIMFRWYFTLRPIGDVRLAPYVMRLGTIERGHEPDLQIILSANAHKMGPTFMDGPADIVIEIISPESFDRDTSIKFSEYEKAKVPEYWIIDPIHREARFYRLDDEGVYEAQPTDVEGNYTTPALPELEIHVPELWEDKLPDAITITRRVEDMLGD
jgi:Uma2 family endonuclease